MKSQKRISSRALSFIFFSCLGLLLSIGLPPGLYGAEYVSPEDREIYFKALEDTETATQAEVVRNLLAIVPGQNWANYNLLHGDNIEWENRYLSELWMVGRRASLLGELAKPPQLHNSGRHYTFC